MRLYVFALFFAVIGMMAGTLGYIMDDSGGESWFNQPVQNMTMIDISQGDINDLQSTEDSGLIDTFENTGKYVSILFSVMKGVLGIAFMLDDFLVFDVGGINLFAVPLYIMQIGIWLVYVFGFAQFILNRSAKGME